MRTRLALIPALWVALTGAALPQSATSLAILECRAPRETAAAAFDKSFPILKTIDRSVAPDLDVTHVYKVRGYGVFGQLVFALGGSHTRTPNKESMMFMSILSAPYAEVRAAALAAHSQTNCLAEEPDRCVVKMAIADGWRQVGLVENREGRGVFTCTYSRTSG